MERLFIRIRTGEVSYGEMIDRLVGSRTGAVVHKVI
jgi:hypothetical protein